MVFRTRYVANGPLLNRREMPVTRTIFTYGLVAGLVVGLPLFGLTVARQGQPHDGVLLGYLTMLVALSAVFVAVKRQRDREGGGVIRFWPAFGLGLGISLVASLCYVLAWEAALMVSQLDFGADYAKALIAQQKAQGLSGEALAKFSAEMEDFARQYRDPLYRLPMTFAEIFPVGLLVSLVSAALLRNSRFLPARRQAASS